jgi:hypothetical protein
MADVTNWYARAGNMLVSADFDFVGDDVRCALLKSNYVPALQSDDTFSDVSGYEVNGVGYTAGGVALTGKSVVDDAPTKETRLDAAPTQWGAGATIADIKYAVLYDNTLAAKPLLALVTFDEIIDVSNGIFRITWAATGALRLKAA